MKKLLLTLALFLCTVPAKADQSSYLERAPVYVYGGNAGVHTWYVSCWTDDGINCCLTPSCKEKVSPAEYLSLKLPKKTELLYVERAGNKLVIWERWGNSTTCVDTGKERGENKAIKTR